MNFNEWLGDTIKRKGFLSPVVYPGDLKMVWDSALEEAAKKCDEYAALEEMGSNEQCAIEDCAEAIRKLK